MEETEKLLGVWMQDKHQCQGLLSLMLIQEKAKSLYEDFKKHGKDSESEVAKSFPTLTTPWAGAYQASPSMGFSRQEYWSGLLFPSPEDLPNPGIEPRFPAS